MAMCSNEMYFSLKSCCAEPLIVENLKIGPATAAPSSPPNHSGLLLLNLSSTRTGN